MSGQKGRMNLSSVAKSSCLETVPQDLRYYRFVDANNKTRLKFVPCSTYDGDPEKCRTARIGSYLCHHAENRCSKSAVLRWSPEVWCGALLSDEEQSAVPLKQRVCGALNTTARPRARRAAPSSLTLLSSAEHRSIRSSGT